MKEPKHPPGPAFENAGDEAEAARQQQIAALSDRQAAAFKDLQKKQKDKEKTLRDQQQRRAADELAKRMRKKLMQDKAPHLRHDAHRHKLKSPQELGKAIQDTLAGRKARVSKEYQSQLAAAQKQAKADIARENKQAQERMAAAHKRKQDEFLKQAAKERRQVKTRAFAKETRRITRNRAAPQFAKAAQDKPAKDQAWQRDFEKAAKAEADHTKEQERETGHDIDRDR